MGRAPTEKELADALDMGLADYQKMLQDALAGINWYTSKTWFQRGRGEDFLERHLADDAADPAKLFEDEKPAPTLVRRLNCCPSGKS
jgi:RNA polymerase sigma factor for flagellar operon FliA